MDKSNKSLDSISEINPNHDSYENISEIADYGNGKFLRLNDINISTITTVEFDEDSMDSWSIYSHYTKLYDLIQFSSLENQFISNIIDVQLYDLCSNDIKALSKALIQNKDVTTLNLSMNKLETTGCNYLSDLLKKNNVIKHLKLSRCKIDIQKAKVLAGALSTTVLKSLDLSYNEVEGAGLRSILEALRKNTNLQELDLSYNGIQSNCLGFISKYIKVNKNLQKLNLTGNFLRKETDLKLLITSLGVSNKTLQMLILQWNGLSGEICANIFQNIIVKTEGLKILDLSWNNNIGTIFGKGIQNTTSLEQLDISHNPLTDDDIVEILDCVQQPLSFKILGINNGLLVPEDIENAILNAQSRVPHFIVKVRAFSDMKKFKFPPDHLAKVYLQRLYYLGVGKRKKKKVKKDNISKALFSMKTENNFEAVPSSVFISTFEKLNIKNGEDIIHALAEEVQDGKNNINVAQIIEMYLALYPNTKT